MNATDSSSRNPRPDTRHPKPDTRYPPRVSILIPNYNNGRESAKDGQADLIGDLLQSLHDTLHDDPTPLEIIAYDDGSTDDSLATLRDWSQRTWRGNQPFLTLIEAPHCGVLAANANKLVAASGGEILCRLDGDITCLTPRWAQKLCDVFDHGPPNLGVVGPKQLNPQLIVHAFGDWLLHPKGYHHVGMGLPRDAVTQPMEVDHVMGCFYCCKREVHDAIGGYDESILRGQTIDFGLRARRAGYRCIAVPQIEFIHRHGTRKPRSTRADTPEGVRHTLDVFERKWGFSRIAPDLDVVREKLAGTAALWNPAVFARTDDPAGGAIDFQASAWQRYVADAGFRGNVDMQVAFAAQVLQQTQLPAQARVLIPGCGTGLLAHLLASRGLTVTGCDRDTRKIELAQRCIANQTYPGARPVFVHQADARALPAADAAFDLALACYLFERHPNPVGLLKELRRVCCDNACLAVVSARRRGDRVDEERYLPHELTGQINAVTGWRVISTQPGDTANQPVVAVARRLAEAAAVAAA